MLCVWIKCALSAECAPVADCINERNPLRILRIGNGCAAASVVAVVVEMCMRHPNILQNCSFAIGHCV